MKRPPIKICRVVTVPSAVLQIKSQLEELVRLGFDVTVVSSSYDNYEGGGGQSLLGINFIESVRIVPIEVARDISFVQDLKTLWNLYRFFRTQKFDIVHSMTPKAGLVTAVSAWLARVPIRIHTFTGQRWFDMHGPIRKLLQVADWIIAQLMTHCYADGHGQARFLTDLGLVPSHKIKVVLKGSVAGVDFSKFNLDRLSSSRADAKAELGLHPHDRVILFVGRLTVDKGIVELVEAFKTVSSSGHRAHLVLLGPFERDLLAKAPDVVKEIESHPLIHALGFKSDVERYMAMADFMVLPSYREGFGVVVIQAAALRIATIGTDIYALRDSVVNNETGVLVPVKDSQSLAQAIMNFLNNPELCKKMGNAAFERSRKYFDSKVFNKAIGEEYTRLIQGNP